MTHRHLFHCRLIQQCELDFTRYGLEVFLAQIQVGICVSCIIYLHDVLSCGKTIMAGDFAFFCSSLVSMDSSSCWFDCQKSKMMLVTNMRLMKKKNM